MKPCLTLTLAVLCLTATFVVAAPRVKWRGRHFESDQAPLTTVIFVLRGRNVSYDQAKFNRFVSSVECESRIAWGITMLSVTKGQLAALRTRFHAEQWDRYMRIKEVANSGSIPIVGPAWTSQGFRLDERSSQGG